MYVLRFLFHIEALLEAINASASVNQLLFARVERMTFGANINFHLFLGGAGLKCFTAYAANDAFAVLGMDVFLHCCFTSFAYAMADNRKRYITIINYNLQHFFQPIIVYICFIWPILAFCHISGLFDISPSLLYNCIRCKCYSCFR